MRLIDADELKDGLKYHYQPTDQECDYDRQWAVGYNAGLNRALYSIAYAHTIEPKQEWISVKDDMPKERESIFARFYGTDKWRTGMFRTASYDVIACVEYEDGSRLVKVLQTISGEWHMSGIPGGGIVTHWMPLPELPERDGDK